MPVAGYRYGMNLADELKETAIGGLQIPISAMGLGRIYFITRSFDRYLLLTHQLLPQIIWEVRLARLLARLEWPRPSAPLIRVRMTESECLRIQAPEMLHRRCLPSPRVPTSMTSQRF
jgi:hypothetical protein